MKERCTMKLERRRLLAGEGPISLGAAAAKDSILSLLFLSERATFLTTSMAEYLTNKFPVSTD